MNTHRKRQASSLLVSPTPVVTAPKALKPATRTNKLNVKVAEVPRSLRKVTLASAPEEDPNDASFLDGLPETELEQASGRQDNSDEGPGIEEAITPTTKREALERKLRRLSIEEKLAMLKNKNKTVVVCSRQNEVTEKVVRVASSGNSRYIQWII